MEKNKLTYVRVKLATILLLTLGLVGCQSPQSTISEYERMSDSWPYELRTKTPLRGKMHGNTVPAGTKGILIRVENETALVDFGHNGIHHLPLADTDFDALFKHGSKRSHGLFSERYEKMFYMPFDLQGLRYGELGSFDYFVIVYFEFDPSLEASSLSNILAVYDKLFIREYNTQIMLLPYGATAPHMRSFIKQNFNYPTVADHLKKSFIHANQHEPMQMEGTVLIDDNGRIIYRSFQEDFSFEDSFRRLKKALKRETARAGRG